jgi:hypothetical protein
MIHRFFRALAPNVSLHDRSHAGRVEPCDCDVQELELFRRVSLRSVTAAEADLSANAGMTQFVKSGAGSVFPAFVRKHVEDDSPLSKLDRRI